MKLNCHVLDCQVLDWQVLARHVLDCQVLDCQVLELDVIFFQNVSTVADSAEDAEIEEQEFTRLRLAMENVGFAQDTQRRYCGKKYFQTEELIILLIRNISLIASCHFSVNPVNINIL